MLVITRPELALVGSFELLIVLIRSSRHGGTDSATLDAVNCAALSVAQSEPQAIPQSLDETVLSWHGAGRSQRSIARELNIGRRKVKQIIDREAA